MDIESRLNEMSGHRAVSRPRIFDCADEFHRAAIMQLIDSGEIQHVVDDYQEQLRELFQINNPTLVYDPSFDEQFRKHLSNLKEECTTFTRHGRWIYYAWNNTVVHVLRDTDFQRVRTARNRNLITEEEQKRYYEAVIGIGGLSVGNSVALAIVLQGGARHIRLADFDSLALSNLNRIRGNVASLGLPKVEMTARQIYELNPYADVEIFPTGLTEETIAAFFDGPPVLNIVIDELDTLSMKLRIREEARMRNIPVVMGADNGDNAVVDIERYDAKQKPRFFHGRLGRVTAKEISNLDKFGIGRTITKHIGPENVTVRMQQSLLEMGKSIVSWPQLGGAALLNGVAVAYSVRKILTGQPIEKNRALISLDEKLVPGYASPRERGKRAKAAAVFKRMFKL